MASKKTKEAEVMEEVMEQEAVDTAADEPAYDPDELVPFFAFKDNGRYKDDIFVAVNGDSLLIQRGKHVMIKRKFYEVLMNSQDQDNATADLIERESSEFAEQSHKMGY